MDGCMYFISRICSSKGLIEHQYLSLEIDHTKNLTKQLFCNCKENGGMVLRSNFCWCYERFCLYYEQRALVAYKQCLQSNFFPSVCW